MTQLQKPKVVCFDLGGVLVRICRSWEEGCAGAEIDTGRSWRPADTEVAHRKLIAEYTVGAIDDQAFFSQLEDIAGSVYNAEEFRRIHRAWVLGVYSGAEELLEELHQSSVTLACLSNTNAAHWRQMADWRVLAALDHRFASHVLGCAKPGSKIYTMFSETLEVAPANIVFFDDLAENIKVALQLGWDAVQIDHAGDTTSQIRHALASRGVLS